MGRHALLFIVLCSPTAVSAEPAGEPAAPRALLDISEPAQKRILDSFGFSVNLMGINCDIAMESKTANTTRAVDGTLADVETRLKH